MNAVKWWYLQFWAFASVIWFISLWWFKREELKPMIKTVADYRDAVFVVSVFSLFGSTAVLGIFWILRFFFRLVP